MTVKRLFEVLSGEKDASALPDSPGLIRRAEHLVPQISMSIAFFHKATAKNPQLQGQQMVNYNDDTDRYQLNSNDFHVA